MQTVKLAWRSLWRNRRRTIITLVSIALGLSFAIFLISMGDGVYYQLVDDAAEMQTGHITIEHPEYRNSLSVEYYVENTSGLRERIGKLSGVRSTKLLVAGQAVARTGSGSSGVAVMGVEPSVEAKTSPIPQHMDKGEYLDDTDESVVVIGSQLARHLNLDIGKKLVLMANDKDGVLVEELFRVKGIFHSGTDEIDGYIVQAPIEKTASFFGLPKGAATQMGVIVKDATHQDRVFAQVSRIVSEEDGSMMAALPWQEIMPDLAAYIKMDKSSNIVMQATLVFLILFTIFNTILMSVLERKREFGMLMAVGSTPGLLRAQVMIESVFIGLIGCAFGVAMGWGYSYYTGVTGIDFSRYLPEGSTVSGFMVDPVLYPVTTFKTLAWSAGLVFIATVFVSIFSIRRIRDVGLADILRHNG